MAVESGHRVLVTGAASGLGLALAKKFVARGCRVLATDLHEQSPPGLDELAAITYRRLDVTGDDDWQAAHDWVAEHWRGLDVLVNNAGVAAGGRIEYSTMEQWRWIVDINLLGVVRGCRTFTPMLKAQRVGHIVNTASAAGLIHPPRMTEYASVKAGVVALSESLGYELKPYGVDVSVVCPTFFRTGLADSLRGSDPTSAKTARKMIDGARLGPDVVAARVMKGIDARRPVILTDREGRIAYATKRFARPVYDTVMATVSSRAAREDGDT